VGDRVPCPVEKCDKTAPATRPGLRLHMERDHPGLGCRERSLLIDQALQAYRGRS